MSFTVTTSYLTKHGIDLKNFKLCLEEVAFTNNAYGSFTHTAGSFPSELPMGGGYRSITYRVSAYVSDEGLAAGNLGIPVILVDGSSTFQVTEPVEFSTVADVMDQCIAHFKTLVS